jgi:iron(III) transport system permease protein
MRGGKLDFAYALDTVADAENLRTIANTMILGVAVVSVSTVIALPLAFLLARTQFARRGWLDTALMIPFMTPPYIASMGWILFMQKRGIFQQLFPFTGAMSEKFFSFGGLVLVMSLHVFPFMLTILKNAIINVGAEMEESAAIFGGGFWYRTRRVTLPLISGNYAIGALLVFVKTLSEYGTPATLGRRIGFSVFATDIHSYATISHIDFGKSASLSGVLIAVCMTAWFLQNYVTTKRSYRLVGAKGARRQTKRLHGAANAAAWGAVALILLISIGIPYFSVICTSLIKLRGYGLAAGNFTFQHYIYLFGSAKGRAAFGTSIFLALSSASIAAFLGTAAAIVSRQKKTKFRRMTEGSLCCRKCCPALSWSSGSCCFGTGSILFCRCIIRSELWCWPTLPCFYPILSNM